MKLLISQCEKAWLFNVRINENHCKAGLACFLPGCNNEITFNVNDKAQKMQTPVKAAFSHVPKRIINARLFLLSASE